MVASDEEILFPKVTRPDLAIALHEAAEEPFAALETKVLFDSGLMKVRSRSNWYGLPFAEIARSLGGAKMANLVAFGAALNLASFLPLSAAEAAARASFSTEAAELNVKALRPGYSEAAGIIETGGRK